MDSSLLPGRLRLHSNDRRRVALVLLRAFQSGDPRWMTDQQAQEKKWQVREDEKAPTIYFAKPYEVEDDEAEDGKKTLRVLKHHPVFHASKVFEVIEVKREK